MITEPLTTASKLFGALTSFVAMNEAFDIIHGDPDKTVLKARAANYGLVRTAIIASDLITREGLDKKYRKYEKKVNLEVAKIAARSKDVNKQ